MTGKVMSWEEAIVFFVNAVSPILEECETVKSESDDIAKSRTTMIMITFFRKYLEQAYKVPSVEEKLKSCDGFRRYVGFLTKASLDEIVRGSREAKNAAPDQGGASS